MSIHITTQKDQKRAVSMLYVALPCWIAVQGQNNSEEIIRLNLAVAKDTVNRLTSGKEARLIFPRFPGLRGLEHFSISLRHSRSW